MDPSWLSGVSARSPSTARSSSEFVPSNDCSPGNAVRGFKIWSEKSPTCGCAQFPEYERPRNLRTVSVAASPATLTVVDFCGDTDRPASVVRVLNADDISDCEVARDKLFSSGSEGLGRSLWLRRVPFPESSGDLAVEDHRRLAKLMGDGLNVRIVEMLCVERRGVGRRGAGSSNLLSRLGLPWNINWSGLGMGSGVRS